MKKLPFIFAILIVSVCAFSLNVSTSILPYYFIVQEILGDKGNVKLIIPSGKSPHTYSLSPKEVAALYDSDVLVLNGLGLEIFISKLEGNLKEENVNILYGYEYIPKDELITGSHHEEEITQQNTEISHNDFEYDPHIWLDSYLVYEYIIPGLKEDFSKMDPSNSEYYERNADNLIKRLILLDEYMKEKAKEIQGAIFTAHNSFIYFSKRYNIQIAGVIESVPGVTPTPKELVELSEIAKNYNVKAIFNEPQLSDKAVNTIAQSLNLKVGILDPLGGTESIFDLESLYIYNLFEIIRVTNDEK